MPSRKPRHPSYRHHKARNCAVVTIHGKDHYLGDYDSDASWEKYHRLMAELHPKVKEPTLPPQTVAAPMSLNELMLRYFTEKVEVDYRKNGEPTSEQNNIAQALGFLQRLYGSTPAVEFGPKRLKAIRQVMIEHPIVRKVKVKEPEPDAVRFEDRVIEHGLARRHINKQIARIKRFFAWAVEEELLPPSVHEALIRVRGLRKNKTLARERKRIRPVAYAAVDAVLPHVQPTVRAMIQVHRLCGCRPQDVVAMRRMDIDTSEAIWEYRPERYKTEHHNDEDDPDLDRVIFLGPRAQEILKPFFTADPSAYLFSPELSEQQRNAEKRQRRQSPLWPSHVQHQEAKKNRRQRPAHRDRYDVTSYRRAIRRGCEKAGIPSWHPNQLRHSRLTEIRKRYGLEASKACAGHKEIGVTQHYADQDFGQARQVMAEIG